VQDSRLSLNQQLEIARKIAEVDLQHRGSDNRRATPKRIKPSELGLAGSRHSDSNGAVPGNRGSPTLAKLGRLRDRPADNRDF
jgi:hypothetical protein